MSFDAKSVLSEIKEKRKVAKRKRFVSSRLDKFTYEILKLKSEKASLADIQVYLKSKRIAVERSTIMRWLKKHG